MIYLKSFLRRIKLKSAAEFSLLFSLLIGIFSGSFFAGALAFPILTLLLLLPAFLINRHASRKITHIKCKLCSFPHCDLLYPARADAVKKEKKGSFACSSFDHGKYPDIYYCPACHNGFLADMTAAHYEETKDHGNKLYKEVVDHQYLEQIGARHKTYENIISKYRPYFQGKDVLEIGCYYGAFYEKVAGHALSYTGIEPSAHAGTYLKKKYPHLAFFNGLLEEAIEQNYLQGKTFDTIVLFDVLEHLPNPQETLTLLRSFLREGGHIIYSTINMEAVISLAMGPFWPWFMDMHYYYFSDRGYRQLLRKSDLVLTKHAHFPYTVSFNYFLSKVTSIFLGAPFPLKRWVPTFNIPIKLGDTVLIIGKKVTKAKSARTALPEKEIIPHIVGENRRSVVSGPAEM